MAKRSTTTEFIEKAIKVHGTLYDYSKVDYKNNRRPVQIICQIHGVFPQSPDNHLRGKGCKFCGGTQKSNTYDFIKKAHEVHANKYDYSKVVYKTGHAKVIIFCPIHNHYFDQTPSSHLSGRGCRICKNEKLSDKFSMGKEGFIDKAKKVHADKYDYSKVNYKNNQTVVYIICKKHNTGFSQEPSNHLIGQGCPICNESKGENFIRKWLEKNKINFTSQKTFFGCSTKNKKGKSSPLEFDFYLPDYNLCIEWDGIQHYEPRDFFGGFTSFERQKYLDQLKNEYCEKNGIDILRIPYTVKTTDNFAGQILKNKLKP